MAKYIVMTQEIFIDGYGCDRTDVEYSGTEYDTKEDALTELKKAKMECGTAFLKEVERGTV